MVTREEIIAAFPIVAEMERDGVKFAKRGANWTCLCMFHKEKTPSMSVNPDKGTFFCFGCQAAGSVIDYISRKSGQSIGAVLKDLSSKLERAGNTVPMKRAPDAIYVYKDETGTEVYRVLRYNPRDPKDKKTFRQQRRIEGGWEWGTEGVRRVLFRLPELIAAKNAPVWICYSPDTEILTPGGWMPITVMPEKVAQYDAATCVISFVQPITRTDLRYEGPMISIQADWCDLLVTPEHRCLVRVSPTTPPKVVEAKDVRYHHMLPTSGFNIDGEGPTEQEARLLAAFQADGTILNNNKNGGLWRHFGWNLKKERKKTRLRSLLLMCGIEWEEQVYDSTKGWTSFIVRRQDAPWLEDWLDSKRFHWAMINWSLAARTALLEELGFWDGDFTGSRGVRFFTSETINAEVVSAIAVMSGWSVNQRMRDRSGQSGRGNSRPEYIVNLKRNTIWRNLAYSPTSVPYRGTVHCLTVPSGFLVVRRNGKVCISGNCEGEKDALNLVRFGWNATTNVGGAGKWMSGYSESLAGRDVIISGDNDDTGKKHIAAVAEALDGKVKSLRIVTIPPPDKDVSDFLARFGTMDAGVAAIEELVNKAPVIVSGSTIPILSMAEMEANYQEYLKTAVTRSYRFGAWLPTFNRKLPRSTPGDLIVFAAGTGVGKTSILQNMAIQAAPLPTLLFEMELSDSLTFKRFVASVCKQRQDDIEATYEGGYIPPWREDGRLNSIYVCPMSGLTVQQMDQIVNRSELKMGIRPLLVMVDYVQLVAGIGGSRYEKMTQVMCDLKSMAKNTGTIVVIASQVNERPAKPGKKVEPEDRMVGLGSNKDTGQIENSASLHIGVWRETDTSQRMFMRVNKGTQGGAGTQIECRYSAPTQEIYEVEPERERTPPPEPDPQTDFDDDMRTI